MHTLLGVLATVALFGLGVPAAAWVLALILGRED